MVIEMRRWCGVLLLAWSILGGCANQPAAGEKQIEAAVLTQAKWFRSLELQQKIEVVLPPVALYQQSSFEVLSEGTLHQYVQGQFPLTHVLFGLYFREGLLESLLLDQQVGDFGWCRTHSWLNEHWLVNRGGSFSAWIRRHNQLGASFNPGMRHPPVVSERMSGRDVAEAATYLPLIAIALPLYAADQLAGGRKRDARKKDFNEQMAMRAMAFEVGQTTRDDVLQNLGSADERKMFGETEVWRYKGPGVWIGMLDGVVVWKESGSFYPPKNTAVNYSRDCAEILGP